MKALVSYAPYDNRYEEVDIPETGQGEMLLKVLGCGICAGDIKAYHGGVRIWGNNASDRYIEAPVIGGHEYFGEIVKLGDGCDGFKIGERVCVEQIVPCGNCEFCQKGKYWMCISSAVYGFKKHIQGGFAEYIKIHKNSLVHKIPNDFTVEQGVLVEPIACGMHAVEQAQIRHTDIVAVAGLGAIGVSMVNLIAMQLPAKIIGIDIKDKRLKKGRAFGADVVINPLTQNLEKEIMAVTDNKGCDVYIEASGSPKSVKQGMNILKNHGRYIQMGVFAKEVTADWNVIGDGKELTILGSHLSALTYPAVIQGIKKGSIKTDGLISHIFKLSEWKKAFETAERDEDAMKVILIPD